MFTSRKTLFAANSLKNSLINRQIVKIGSRNITLYDTFYHRELRRSVVLKSVYNYLKEPSVGNIHAPRHNLVRLTLVLTQVNHKLQCNVTFLHYNESVK